jgi:predicted aldo/keto reductase-like oxidoreductase
VSRGLDRRDFLRQGAAAALGTGALGVGALGAIAASTPPRVQRYAPLGRTGLEISDISFGSSRNTDPAVVRHAFERGINYFDTAEGYRGGRSEESIGEALRGVREKVILASKTEAAADATRADLMRALEGSLARLKTDRIDVYFNHAVNDPARLRNPEWAEFVEKARRQGKIRWRGMSGHGGRLAECLDLALANDLVDVILVAHNFGQDPAFYQRFLRDFDFVALQPELPRLLARAHAAGVGVIAMKTLMGARLNDMRPYEHGGTSFAQAAFRWVLANPDVDALVVSMTGSEQIDEYLGASGAARNRRADLELLERYAGAQVGRYCQHGCNRCEPSCPAGVPISEVLRARMYDVDYGDRELARAAYAELGPGSSACLGCSAQPCLGACPNGIPVARFALDAALRLG